MKFHEITGRLTGLSCPIFGVSWTPPEPERKIARRIVTFLEDRRVLYSPSEVEIPAHCVDSVIEIRHYLTYELQGLDRDTPLSATLRALRAACRKFLTTIGPMDHRFGPIGHGYQDWVFLGALRKLRGTFGIHLATLATAYGLDIEDPLAAILPAEVEDEDGRQRRSLVPKGTGLLKIRGLSVSTFALNSSTPRVPLNTSPSSAGLRLDLATFNRILGSASSLWWAEGGS